MWDLDLSRISRNALTSFQLQWDTHIDVSVDKKLRYTIIDMTYFDTWMGRRDNWDEIIQGDMP